MIKPKQAHTALSKLMQEADEQDSKLIRLGEVFEQEDLFRLVGTVIDEGGAVLIGRTGDGGALCVKFYLDDSKTKRYVATVEQGQAVLAALGIT